jgi:olfactory receptor
MKVSLEVAGRRHITTCCSPLSVIATFYGTTIVFYLCPSSIHAAVKEKASAIIYTAITPMLNLLICSLRNRDLKGALKQLISILITSSS